jgi:DNA-directed RNA polymerase subunit E'/Rpb7
MNTNTNVEIDANIFKYKTTIRDSTNILLTPQYLNKQLDKHIYNKLALMIENKCISYGYVLPGTINIIERSRGVKKENTLQGNITFTVIYDVDIISPKIDEIIECTVTSKNMVGLTCILHPLQITLPISMHDNKKAFDNINQNDKISVRIKFFKYNINANVIKIMGMLL